MRKNETSKHVGMGLADTLCVVFVVLKLCGVIDWSWWWVLSPLWISLGLGLLLIGIAGVIGYLAER